MLCRAWCFGRNPPKWDRFPVSYRTPSHISPRVPEAEGVLRARTGILAAFWPLPLPLFPGAAHVSRASVSGCVSLPSQPWEVVSPTWSPHSLWLDGVFVGGNQSERLELQTSFTGTWPYDKKGVIYCTSHTHRDKNKRMRKFFPGKHAAFPSPHLSHRPIDTSSPL